MPLPPRLRAARERATAPLLLGAVSTLRRLAADAAHRPLVAHAHAERPLIRMCLGFGKSLGGQDGETVTATAAGFGSALGLLMEVALSLDKDVRALLFWERF